MIFIYGGDIEQENVQAICDTVGVSVEVSTDADRARKVLKLMRGKYSKLFISKDYGLSNYERGLDNVEEYSAIGELYEKMGYKPVVAVESEPITELESVEHEVDFGSTTEAITEADVAVGGDNVGSEDLSVVIEGAAPPVFSMVGGVVQPVPQAVVANQVNQSNKITKPALDVTENVHEVSDNEKNSVVNEVSEVGANPVVEESTVVMEGSHAEENHVAVPQFDSNVLDGVMNNRRVEELEKELKAIKSEKEKLLKEKSETLVYIKKIEKQQRVYQDRAERDKQELISKCKELQCVIDRVSVKACLNALSHPNNKIKGSGCVIGGAENIKVLAIASSDDYKAVITGLVNKVNKGEQIIIADFTCGCVIDTAFGVKVTKSFDIENVSDIGTLATSIKGSKLFGSSIIQDIALLNVDWSGVVDKLVQYAKGKEVYICLSGVSNFTTIHTIVELRSAGLPVDVYITATPTNVLSAYNLRMLGDCEGINYKLLGVVPAVEGVISGIFGKSGYKKYPMNYDIDTVFKE